MKVVLLFATMLGMVYSQAAAIAASAAATAAAIDLLNPGYITGNLFLGAMSATQADIFNTNTTCYAAAALVKIELEIMLAEFNPAVISERFQVFNIKSQACFATCNIEMLVTKLDSRMSTLDFTLGLISNVIAQFGGGI